MRNTVLRVGGGRGFVVNRRGYLGRPEPIVITAAHCLPRSRLPVPHPARAEWEATYPRLLGPLGGKRTVAADCLFTDVMADIAAFGRPTHEDLYDEALAYDALVEGMTPLPIADAPKQGVELLTLAGIGGRRGRQIKVPTQGEGAALVLSLDGQWREGKVQRRGNWLEFTPGDLFVGGMSGSPILDAGGAAIGVVSVSCMSPVIVDNLSAHLVRSIRAAR
jgi:hypothetical protein